MMKKTINIITIYVHNYGAILQAYALQHFLQSATNCNVRIVDFYHKQYKQILRFTRDGIIINLTLTLFKLLRYFQLKRRIKREDDFMNRHMYLTARYDSYDDLLHNPPKADIYITGSDQVFNLDTTYSKLFYLDFEINTSRRVAYAPSFGISEFSDEFIQKISTPIKRFDSLSCRESKGAELLSKITCKDVPTVLDPIFLIDNQEWSTISVNPRINYKYIFIYDLNGGNHLIELARKIKLQTNFKIICLTSTVYKFYDVDKQLYDAGPAEFLGWIENAEYVITDSFHGTAFSLIFHKEFFTYIAIPRTAERIITILHNLNLMGRLFNDSIVDFDLNDLPKLKYDNVLKSMVDASKQYLLSAI